MSILGRFFGTDKAIDKTIGLIGKVADEAFYTKEEKAADRAKAVAKAQDFALEWLQSTSGSRLARRFLAVSMSGTWLVMFITATILDVISSFTENHAIILEDTMREVNKYALAANAIDNRLDIMTGAVMVILGFYFAAPYAGDIIKGALLKFGGKKDAI